MTATTSDDIIAIGPCLRQGTVCAKCILDGSEYFAMLGLEAKQALQAILQCRNLKRRTNLYREGQVSEHLFILLSGEIKIYKSLPNGRQQIHKLIVTPGDLIACEDIYRDAYGSTAETLDQVSVCCWRKNELQALAERHPDIATSLLQSMARHLNGYIQYIANFGQKTAIERVASYLVYLCIDHAAHKGCPHKLSVSLTRAELAELLGITQRTLFRCLKTLERAKFLSLRRNGFIIHDGAALIRLSGYA